MNSCRHEPLPSAVRLAPIDPLKQHRQLSACERDLALSRLRPHKPAPLQPLLEQTQTVSIVPKQLDDITSAATKTKDVTGERLLFEHRLHLRTQTRKSPAHVRHARRDPYLRVRRRRDRSDHVSRHPSTVRRVSPSTAPAIRNWPQPKLSSMVPVGQSAIAGHAVVAAPAPTAVPDSASSDTTTGNSRTRSRPDAESSNPC